MSHLLSRWLYKLFEKHYLDQNITVVCCSVPDGSSLQSLLSVYFLESLWLILIQANGANILGVMRQGIKACS